MASVAFHGLVLKYSFMLERRASSYKGCAAVVNTCRVLHHLFFSFSPVLLSFLWHFSILWELWMPELDMLFQV